MTALDLLNLLREWSSEAWSLGCVLALAVIGRLLYRTSWARRRLQAITEEKTPVSDILKAFERLALVKGILCLLLLAVGIWSLHEPHTDFPPGVLTTEAVYRTIVTLVILVSIPFVLTWTAWKAFRIYQG
jgi:hypothetical protein